MGKKKKKKKGEKFKCTRIIYRRFENRVRFVSSNVHIRSKYSIFFRKLKMDDRAGRVVKSIGKSERENKITRMKKDDDGSRHVETILIK